MKEYVYPHFDCIEHATAFNSDCLPFTKPEAQKAIQFHNSLPGYHETPLISLQCAAAKYQV